MILILSLIDKTNIWALSPLCQEYQVDWLLGKIKSFVSGSSSSNTKTLLRYLTLAEDLDFGFEFEQSLIEKLKDPFPLIQAHFEFLLLSRRTEIWIARRCLAKLVDSYYSEFHSELPHYSMIDSEIVSFFEELDQPNIPISIG